MIIAVIGSNEQDILSTVSVMISEKVQYIDTTELLRNVDSKTLNNLTIKGYHKRFVLKKYEKEFGTIVVSGNLILSEDICEWLLKTGNKVLIASRENFDTYPEKVTQFTGRYWEDKASQKYNLTERYQNEYNRLTKIDKDSVLMVDHSNRLSVAALQDFVTGSHLTNSKFITESYEELSEMITIERSNNMAKTMEESIKQAMRDLGMNIDDDAEEVVKPQKSAPKKKDTPKVASQPKKQEKAKKEETEFMNPPQPEEPEEATEKSDDTDSLFVKCTDTTMAILIPEELQLESQVIAGMKFNVATVSLPNLKSRSLQELQMLNTAKNETTVTRVPIIPEKEEKKAEKSVKKQEVKAEIPDELEELHEKKAELDKQIKAARAEGDIETVNELRKQRRAVRNKINSLK